MIKLSDHAKEAIALRSLRVACAACGLPAQPAGCLRSLRVEWVAATVDAPDAVRPDARRPGVTLSFKVIADSGGRVLRVAHRPDGADVLVISAHFDRGAKL